MYLVFLKTHTYQDFADKEKKNTNTKTINKS